MEYQTGEWVAWTKNVKDNYFLRCGEIVGIIPSGVDLMDVIGDDLWSYRSTGRQRVSSNTRYAVRVQQHSPSGNALKPHLYTPTIEVVERCMNYSKLSRYAYAKISVSEKIKRPDLVYSKS